MLVTLFVLQMALTILATIPMAAIQNTLEKSIVAKHNHPEHTGNNQLAKTNLGDKFNRNKKGRSFPSPLFTD